MMKGVLIGIIAVLLFLYFTRGGVLGGNVVYEQVYPGTYYQAYGQ